MAEPPGMDYDSPYLEVSLRADESPRNDPRPVTVLVRAELIGGHVHMGVWIGRQPGSRGKAGTLTVREDEWPSLRRLLEEGPHEVELPVTIEEQGF